MLYRIHPAEFQSSMIPLDNYAEMCFIGNLFVILKINKILHLKFWNVSIIIALASNITLKSELTVNYSF